MPNEQLDQDAVRLAKAMRKVESGDNFNAKGSSGEWGAYQWMPETWKEHSRKAGVNAEFGKATPQQQNEVAYRVVKQWKDEGYKPSQIASMWNAGPGRPNAYRENWRGVNSQGVTYDTVGHVQRVREAYESLKGFTVPPPPQGQPFQPIQTDGLANFRQEVNTPSPTLLGQVGQDFNRAGTGVQEAMLKTKTGEIDPLSGILQGAGAVAGTVGDVTDTAIKAIPVVGDVYEKGTDIIGGAVQGALNTETGRSISESLSPKTKANIGAIGNILSVVPLFKGLSTLKRGAGDAITTARQGAVESAAKDELRDVLSTVPTRGLDRAEGRGLDPLSILATNRNYLPDTVKEGKTFKYDSSDAKNNLQKDISADELALQNLFESHLRQKPGQELGININDVRKKTLDDVLSKTGLTGAHSSIKKAIEGYFDSYAEALKASSGREFITISELNNIKRDLRDSLNFDAIDPFSTPAKQAKANASQSVMKQVEEAAKKLGIEGVTELNKSMAGKLQALKVLEAVNKKSVKRPEEGLIKSVARDIPGLGGAMRFADRRGPRTATSRLRNRRRIRETAQRGLIQGGTGLALSGQLTSERQKSGTSSR